MKRTRCPQCGKPVLEAVRTPDGAIVLLNIGPPEDQTWLYVLTEEGTVKRTPDLRLWHYPSCMARRASPGVSAGPVIDDDDEIQDHTEAEGLDEGDFRTIHDPEGFDEA